MDDPGDNTERRFTQTILRLFMVSSMVLVLIFFSFFLTYNRIDTADLEMDVFVNRLIYSTTAMADYDEELGRTYFGRIDLEKMTTENLERSINYSNNHFFAARITVAGREPVYYHQALFERMEPLANAGIRGPGGADKLDPPEEFKVTFMEDGELKTANMRIEVLRARS